MAKNPSVTAKNLCMPPGSDMMKKNFDGPVAEDHPYRGIPP